MLDNIRIVLVNTSHTGNIGSVARAMKTMGLSQLTLVDPVQKPDSHASALAAGATDVLHGATIVDDLSTAIADCGLVIGTSARNRTWIGHCSARVKRPGNFWRKAQTTMWRWYLVAKAAG